MGWKKIIIGEKMPDKDDPAYKEKREKAENAGKTFAETLRLNKAAAYVQGFATKHTKLFLGGVFAFVLFSVSLNLYRMCTAVQRHNNPVSAIERQEKALHLQRHHQQQNEQREQNNQIANSRLNDEYEAYRED